MCGARTCASLFSVSHSLSLSAILPFSYQLESSPRRDGGVGRAALTVNVLHGGKSSHTTTRVWGTLGLGRQGLGAHEGAIGESRTRRPGEWGTIKVLTVIWNVAERGAHDEVDLSGLIGLFCRVLRVREFFE